MPALSTGQGKASWEGTDLMLLASSLRLRAACWQQSSLCRKPW